MSLEKHIEEHLNHFIQTALTAEFSDDEKLIPRESWFAKVLKLLENIKTGEKKLFFLGNGASASMAAHFSTDFTKNGNIASYSNIEGSFLTCFSNDYSYENAYMEMLKRLMKDGDALITISSSGSSPNLLIAADYVKKTFANSPIITFTSFNSHNPLRSKGHYNLYVKSDDYSFAESAHAYYLHLLTDLYTRHDKYNLQELLNSDTIEV
jgi:D-sedoheptulose 7-phosphate isomerase